MDIVELFIISIGLASDTFAVSLCKGVTIKNDLLKNNLLISLSFAIVQVLMPFIGFLLGNTFRSFVTSIDHWVAFVILLVIGFGMLYETYIGEKMIVNDKMDFKSLLLPAVATSIDALAIGITFSFFYIPLWFIFLVIGLTTFCMSFIGVIIGFLFGKRFEDVSKVVGGLILIIMGIKILLEHLC